MQGPEEPGAWVLLLLGCSSVNTTSITCSNWPAVVLHRSMAPLSLDRDYITSRAFYDDSGALAEVTEAQCKPNRPSLPISRHGRLSRRSLDFEQEESVHLDEGKKRKDAQKQYSRCPGICRRDSSPLRSFTIPSSTYKGLFRMQQMWCLTCTIPWIVWITR